LPAIDRVWPGLDKVPVRVAMPACLRWVMECGELDVSELRTRVEVSQVFLKEDLDFPALYFITILLLITLSLFNP
jgi:hypothetical protein